MATEGQLKFFASLSSLSKEEQFCDVSLELSDGQSKCNRLVLAAVSPFFNAMLSADMLEGQSGLVKLPTVSAATFDAILDFYVHGKGELQDPEVDETLNASEMMQLPEMKDVCLKDMDEKITPKTSLQAWQIARKFAAKDLVIAKAFEVLIENFELVSKQDDFLSLSIRDLMTILKYKGLNRPLDDHILEAVLRWIESNEPTEDAAQDLVDNLRLDYVTPGCIVKNVDRVKLVQKYSGIVETMKKELTREHTTATKEVIIIPCSSSNGMMQVYAYDPIGTRWYCLSQDIRINLKHFAATFADSKIIVSGGHNEKRWLSNTYIFNTLTNLWYRGPTLHKARYHHSSVSINSVAYVLGGYYSGEKVSDYVEELPPTQKKWRVAGTLCTPTANAAVSTSGNYILIFGGVEGSIKTIQCFSVDTNTSCVIQTIPDKMSVEHIFSRYCYMLYSYSLSVLYLEDEEKTSLVVNKGTLDVPYGITTGSTSFGVVALNGRIIVFSEKYSKEIRINAGKTTAHTLPKIPISLSEVCGAFKSRVAAKCLRE